MVKQPPTAKCLEDPDAAVLAQEAVVELFRTADLVRRRLAATIEPFGVTGQQYNVLRILRGAAPEPLPTMEVAERMLEHTPAMTGLLDRLERKGLVRRERCQQDRRVWHYWITEEGLNLLSKMDEPIDRFNREVVKPLGMEPLRNLIGLLRKIQEV